MLANIACHAEMVNLIKTSGVLRLYTPFPEGKAYFVHHFYVILEMCRLIANFSVNPKAHLHCRREALMGFLGDSLSISFSFIRRQDPKSRPEVTLEFGTDDPSPLGLKIRWEDPPVYIGVVPATPAER